MTQSQGLKFRGTTLGITTWGICYSVVAAVKTVLEEFRATYRGGGCVVTVDMKRGWSMSHFYVSLPFTRFLSWDLHETH